MAVYRLTLSDSTIGRHALRVVESPRAASAEADHGEPRTPDDLREQITEEPVDIS